MAPPAAAAIIIVSVATTAVVAYVVKEAWEPHIKPELLKARHAARTWWNKRRPLTPLRVNTPGLQRKDSKRSLSDSPEEGGTRLQVLVSSAREPPVETHDGARLLQRSAANRDGAATPNETVAESGELDKANPWIMQAPITPSRTITQSDAQQLPSAADQSTDAHHSGNHSTDTFSLNPRPLGQNNELHLSFPGSSSHLSSLSHIPNTQSSTTSGSPTVFRSAGSPTNLNSTSLPPMAQFDRTLFMSSPDSAFSWANTSPVFPAVDGRRSVAFPVSVGDDFVHLRDDDAERSENAFSIGSYDDLTGSSANEVSQHGRSDAGSAVDDDDEPTSPPHNSEQGSPRMKSSSSSSGWESIGSPSSDGRRLV